MTGYRQYSLPVYNVNFLYYVQCDIIHKLLSQAKTSVLWVGDSVLPSIVTSERDTITVVDRVNDMYRVTISYSERLQFYTSAVFHLPILIDGPDIDVEPRFDTLRRIAQAEENKVAVLFADNLTQISVPSLMNAVHQDSKIEELLYVNQVLPLRLIGKTVKLGNIKYERRRIDWPDGIVEISAGSALYTSAASFNKLGIMLMDAVVDDRHQRAQRSGHVLLSPGQTITISESILRLRGTTHYTRIN